MQKTTVSMFLFVLLTLTLTQLAVAQWQDNIVTNQTTEDIYIVYSTLRGRNSSGSIPAGHRTTGFYRIQADQRRVFRAWANNPIYFQIWKGGRAIKPLSSTQTVSAWVHPNQGFTVVTESAISTPVSTAQIRYTSRSRNELEQRDGFIRYANGARISVTSGWVPVNEAVPPPDLPVDVNGDCVVDASDVALVASRLGQTGADTADVNGDGVVNAADITLVTNALGTVIDDCDGTSPGGGTIPDGMVLIPAGEFEMGSDAADSQVDEQPIHTVYVDAFYMDEHEVTNLDYKRFVLANPQWQKDRIPRSLHNGNYLHHWSGNNYPAGKANHPVTFVSWYGAMAYAAWAGKRLPTEAEWERAARGSRAGLKYPWGNTIDSSKANYNNHIKDTTRVGSYPANDYGLYDMAGNVWEWCLDAYDGDFYFSSPGRNPLSDVNTLSNLDLVTSDFTNVKSPRVLRGGSWNYSARYLRVADRAGVAPAYASFLYGFRCARAVSP